MISRALGALVLAVTATLASGLTSPSYADALGETLTVSPVGYPTTTSVSFKVNTYEDDDDRPIYNFSVTDLSSGAGVPVRYGMASDPSPSSTYEWNYTTYSASALAVGNSYEATLQIDRSAHYVCSIYVESGCYWREARTTVTKWRFTRSGSQMTGTLYVPPAPTPTAAKPKNPSADSLLASARCSSARKALRKAKATHSRHAVKRAKKKVREVC